MAEITVDQVTVVVEQSVFHTKSSGKSSWKFCYRTFLTRKEVLFFVQMFVILMLIALCFVKLTVLRTQTQMRRNFSLDINIIKLSRL